MWAEVAGVRDLCKGWELLIMRITYTAGGEVVWRDLLTVEEGED